MSKSIFYEKCKAAMRNAKSKSVFYVAEFFGVDHAAAGRFDAPALPRRLRLVVPRQRHADALRF